MDGEFGGHPSTDTNPDKEDRDVQPPGHHSEQIRNSAAKINIRNLSRAQGETQQAAVTHSRSKSDTISHRSISGSSRSRLALTSERPRSFSDSYPSMLKDSVAPTPLALGSCATSATSSSSKCWLPSGNELCPQQSLEHGTSNNDSSGFTVKRYSSRDNYQFESIIQEENSVHGEDTTAFRLLKSANHGAMAALCGLDHLEHSSENTHIATVQPQTLAATGVSTTRADPDGSVEVGHQFSFTLMPIREAQKQSQKFNSPLLPELHPEMIDRPRNPTPLAFSGIRPSLRGRPRGRTVTFSDDGEVEPCTLTNTAGEQLLRQLSAIDGAVLTGSVHSGATPSRRTPTPYPEELLLSPDAERNRYRSHVPSTSHTRAPDRNSQVRRRLDSVFDLEAGQPLLVQGSLANNVPDRRPDILKYHRRFKQCLMGCGIFVLLYWIAIGSAVLAWNYHAK
ncbi:hypothetical protein MKZ38_010634 [Zalerion maritima]|uniref:Uncharacterized protein n=1 Tax=Zalerion maritima TaxID=339359 RepID=A0AAD5RJI2_9PEZI|nr:hypothetical protein MKZ38_010634 [Zalerion maritima]